MKKIMFNDRYGLTKAVLEGRKTMTRRIIKAPLTMEGKDVYGFTVVSYHNGGIVETIEVMAVDEDGAMINNILPKYKVGEVVAVAQAYKDTCWTSPVLRLKDRPGWNNKMFVYAGLMPHQIRITNVRIERLQDISDEDCLREGIFWDYGDYPYMATKVYKYNEKEEYIHPKAAFAALIDKVSGKGTWEANPWVYAYEFELVK